MAWEYMTWNSAKPIEYIQLNSFGRDGWELVSTVYFADSDDGFPHYYYFKRPLPDESDESASDE